MTLSTRRAVLKNGLLAIGSGLLAPGIADALAAAPAHAARPLTLQRPRATLAGNGKILVVVQLAGGNDGLHSVIPYADPLYAQMRPTLGVATADQIPLNAQLALHAKLGALKPLWDSGQMAIIENVGYPNPNLSHFQSMYIWQTLDMTGAQGTAKTGWLGNYLQTIGASAAHPFAGLESGNQMATAFMAPGVAIPTITAPEAFAILPDSGAPARSAARQDALLKLYASYGQAQGNFADLFRATTQSAATGAQQLHQAAQNYKPAAPYPQTPLASSLQLVATAITQGLDLRVGYVTIGGFDTHANQASTLDSLYAELAQAIAAFWQDLHAQGADGDVLLMTWSEFGRRVRENASGGTDHGTAAPLFVIGPGVNGGVHGDPPDLANLDQAGDLLFQIDFRAVYATILQQWLGVDANSVLGGSFEQLDFVL